MVELIFVFCLIVIIYEICKFNFYVSLSIILAKYCLIKNVLLVLHIVQKVLNFYIVVLLFCTASDAKSTKGGEH